MTDVDARSDDARSNDARTNGADAEIADGASGGGGPRSRLVRWLAIAAGAAVLGLILLLAFADTGGDRSSTEVVGRVAPAIVATDMTGEPFDLDDYRGRWVLVNFFATWCPPCVTEHPELVLFSASHAEVGDAVVVSIAFNDEADEVASFFAERGGDWPVVVADTGRFAIDYGVVAVPESYLVDPFGIVQGKFTGGVTQEGIDDVIARLTGADR